MTVRHVIEKLTKRGLLERFSIQGTIGRKPEVLRIVDKNFSIGLTQMLEGASA